MLKLVYMDIGRLCGASIPELAKRLSPERQSKTYALRKQQDKLLCLGAGLVLDHCLEEYDLSEREMIYACGKHGKPYFKNARHICFNISHSENMVAVAVSDKEVGCDIEALRDVDLRIADRFFTAKERGYVLSAENEEAVKRRFFDIWTRKESCIKAIGAGFSFDLRGFDVLREFVVLEGKSYHLRQCDAPQGYVISCCSASGDAIDVTEYTELA